MATEAAEAAIIKEIEIINEKLKHGAVIDEDYCPGILIRSQVLVTVMGRLARALNINIPEDQYLFFDKSRNEQLSIRAAAKKMISTATNN